MTCVQCVDISSVELMSLHCTHVIRIFQQANVRKLRRGRARGHFFPSFLPSSFRICISDTRGGKIRAEASLVDAGVRHARSFARGDKNFQEKLPLPFPSPPLLSRASLVICPVYRPAERGSPLSQLCFIKGSAQGNDCRSAKEPTERE